MGVKVFAALALAASALIVSTASVPAGSAHSVGRTHDFLRHAHVPHMVAAAQAKKTKLGFNCVVSCAAYESTVDQFFTDVAADSSANATTNVYSVLPQYSTPTSSILYNVAFDAGTNAFVDPNPLPKTGNCQDGFDTYCVTDAELQKEIGKVITANGWPTQSSTALYFILLPANVGVCFKPGAANDNNPCTTNYFCAYHSNTTNFIYAVQPDAAAVIGDACSTGQEPAGNAADPTINTISHEQIEAITDPQLDAWYSDVYPNPEIGDLCAYDFGPALGGNPGALYNQVINGHDYYLQLEYSNLDSGCVSHLGGTVTPPDPNLQDGSGPLAYDGHHQGPGVGPVMASNTVYAIYWIPAAPANSRAPKIVGATTVGKKLRALSGGWSGAPDFTYRWLRCSAAGTSCHAIAKAADSTYVLAPADSGHRIEVRVTATNPAGRVTAASVPTAKVRS